MAEKISVYVDETLHRTQKLQQPREVNHYHSLWLMLRCKPLNAPDRKIVSVDMDVVRESQVDYFSRDAQLEMLKNGSRY